MRDFWYTAQTYLARRSFEQTEHESSELLIDGDRAPFGGDLGDGGRFDRGIIAGRGFGTGDIRLRSMASGLRRGGVRIIFGDLRRIIISWGERGDRGLRFGSGGRGLRTFIGGERLRISGDGGVLRFLDRLRLLLRRPAM